MDFALSDHEVDSETHLIELGGELDLYTAPEFEKRLGAVIEDGKKRVVVDLSRTPFVDSTGLRVFVTGHRRLQSEHGALALVCVDENILRVLEITGIDKLLSIHATLDEALTAMAERP